jgi:hypothetical protein
MYGSKVDWDFLVLPVQEYLPDDIRFDLVTMLHVAEHLTLVDLTEVLNRLVEACQGIFLVESPEQFDDNRRSAEDKKNPWELHLSLPTPCFLNRWGFQPLLRYWQNPRFSNVIYLGDFRG